jgi:hypothetical protein
LAFCDYITRKNNKIHYTYEIFTQRGNSTKYRSADSNRNHKILQLSIVSATQETELDGEVKTSYVTINKKERF